MATTGHENESINVGGLKSSLQALKTKYIDDLEEAIGTGGSVDTRIATAKSEILGDAGTDYNTLGKLEDAIQTEASTRSSEIGTDSTSGTIKGRISSLETLVGSTSVDTQINNKINSLDSTKSQSAGSDGLALSITETDGKITSISGSIASGTYATLDGSNKIPSSQLPIASSDKLGGVKIGTNLSIDNNGVLSATGKSGSLIPINSSIFHEANLAWNDKDHPYESWPSVITDGDQVICFYTSGSGHVASDLNSDVIMRKKTTFGDFTEKKIILQHTSGVGYGVASSCKLKNGDYLIIATILTTEDVSSQIMAFKMVKSSDGGNTWTDMGNVKVNNTIIKDECMMHLFCTSTGKLISFVGGNSYRKFIVSDDNGASWRFIDSNFTNALEAGFYERSNGEILAILRQNNNTPALIKLNSEITSIEILYSFGNFNFPAYYNPTSIVKLNNGNILLLGGSRRTDSDGNYLLYESIVTESDLLSNNIPNSVILKYPAAHLADWGYSYASQSSDGNIYAYFYGGTTVGITQIYEMIGNADIANSNGKNITVGKITGTGELNICSGGALDSVNLKVNGDNTKAVGMGMTPSEPFFGPMGVATNVSLGRNGYPFSKAHLSEINGNKIKLASNEVSLIELKRSTANAGVGILYQPNNQTTNYWKSVATYDLKFVFEYKDSEKVVFTSNGEVGIGTSSPQYKLDVNGGCRATSYEQGSDIRYKDVIEDKILDVEDIADAPIFKFKWKESEDKEIHVGTSAQYWQRIIPEVVSGEEKLSMQYDVLSLLSVVSLSKEVISLKETISDLEKRIKILEERL